jgi:hypothetical protein
MCNMGMFDHDIGGDGPSDRAAAAGLSYSLAENISANLDPGAAEYGWMEEPTCRGHRGNNLSPKAFQAAVGYHICDRPTNEYHVGSAPPHHHELPPQQRHAQLGLLHERGDGLRGPAQPAHHGHLPADAHQLGLLPHAERRHTQRLGLPQRLKPAPSG